jgi:hypothetical protein
VRERDAVVLTLVAVAAAYATAFGAAFQYDDLHTVVANAEAHGWAAWAAALPGVRALTKASYVASHALSPSPWSYVLVGVLLHATSAVLVLRLARRWLPALGVPAASVAFAALVAALAFALHPAQTEAVTYVSGRSVALSACLYLAACLAYEHWRDDGARGVPRAVSLGAFALALAARETAWTLPFALVLLEGARGARWRDAFRSASSHFLVLAAGLAAIAISPTYRRLLRESLATRGPIDNLVAQVEGVGYLVSHPLLTLRLNFDPDVVVRGPSDVGWWIGAAGLLAAIGLGFALLRRAPWCGLGVLWFFLHLVPTNGVVARYDLVNDRQLYLALIGPALIAGVALARIAAVRLRAAIAALLLGALGAVTAVRNIDYRSPIALWEATVRTSPGKSRPWNNLGWAWQEAGDRAKAREAYARAVALDPQNFRARANLEALSR